MLALGAEADVALGIDTRLTLVVTGFIFLSALILGTWKYHGIRTSPDGAAHIYVDIAHRAALMYAFAGLVLAVFTELSAWPTAVNLVAAAVVLAFFVGAIATYAWHGYRRDTTNQFHGDIDTSLRLSMFALIVGEIGGFLVLFTGFLVGQF
ncbi:hypothetical protein GV794_20225 [Nocardia cyriacigeorgica]|uniref:Integral membrane protein n=1 Tax=Nocardia cyriacigeorgica TaxID=135487 RepID=A0ABX0CRC8_9NOCA|nr:hypothetical protein [Nocardia cyriacigeorgica]NEW39110.1 hypothetical protein [Nocardia cyriacigeorgica]NEW52746.1 hypothetical protein [Nocardia cyriacigeorgica]NEW57963.1 hypothetical protein [Nocardia cyriacigeorgica]